MHIKRLSIRRDWLGLLFVRRVVSPPFSFQTPQPQAHVHITHAHRSKQTHTHAHNIAHQSTLTCAHSPRTRFQNRHLSSDHYYYHNIHVYIICIYIYRYICRFIYIESEIYIDTYINIYETVYLWICIFTQTSHKLRPTTLIHAGGQRLTVLWVQRQTRRSCATWRHCADPPNNFIHALKYCMIECVLYMTHIDTHTHAHVNTRTHTHAHKRTHTGTHTRTHSHILTHTNISLYVCM